MLTTLLGYKCYVRFSEEDISNEKHVIVGSFLDKYYEPYFLIRDGSGDLTTIAYKNIVMYFNDNGEMEKE